MKFDRLSSSSHLEFDDIHYPRLRLIFCLLFSIPVELRWKRLIEKTSRCSSSLRFSSLTFVSSETIQFLQINLVRNAAMHDDDFTLARIDIRIQGQPTENIFE